MPKAARMSLEKCIGGCKTAVFGGGKSPRCSDGKCVTRLSRSAGAAGYKSADVVDMGSYMQAVRQPK